ncbi:MAG: hypothetical protein JSR70_09485 [Proteobacteria bacterium]|nr:hypothetical protein [Pseudomonadota bacterium]
MTVNIHADDGSEIALVNCIVSESSTGEVALSVVHASVKDGPTEATGASLDAAAAALADHFAA